MKGPFNGVGGGVISAADADGDGVDDVKEILDCTDNDGKLPTKNYISFKVDLGGDPKKNIPKGNYWIQFSGVTNPLSYEPTINFMMLTQDYDNRCISYGSLDNIQMNKMGEFRGLDIKTNNDKNGEQSTWTVEFEAIAVVHPGDLFTLQIPRTIKTPTDPICEAVKCLVY